MGTTNSDIADLVLIRFARNENCTEGILKLNGKYVAHTLGTTMAKHKARGQGEGQHGYTCRHLHGGFCRIAEV